MANSPKMSLSMGIDLAGENVANIGLSHESKVIYKNLTKREARALSRQLINILNKWPKKLPRPKNFDYIG